MAKPFLKWVGGKRQLIPVIHSMLPENIHNYYELFLGGGAVFFSIADRIKGKAILNDFNGDLIDCYRDVRFNVEHLIAELKQHKGFHDEHAEEYFYKVRTRFNEVKLPADFLYLNKTCFNGLYRVNKKGEFNVPFGKYKNPQICDEDNLRACSAELKKVYMINSASYEYSYCSAPGEKFFYLDPPYYPLTKTSNFTSYTSDGFGHDAQVKLRNFCNCVHKDGHKFMQSNSSAPEIFELYKDYKITVVSANRNINSNASKRGAVNEVIITNY